MVKNMSELLMDGLTLQRIGLKTQDRYLESNFEKDMDKYIGQKDFPSLFEWGDRSKIEDGFKSTGTHPVCVTRRLESPTTIKVSWNIRMLVQLVKQRKCLERGSEP